MKIKFIFLLITFLTLSSLVYANDDKIEDAESAQKQKESDQYTIYQNIDKDSVNPQVFGELGSPYSPMRYMRYYNDYDRGFYYRQYYYE